VSQGSRDRRESGCDEARSAITYPTLSFLASPQPDIVDIVGNNRSDRQVPQMPKKNGPHAPWPARSI